MKYKILQIKDLQKCPYSFDWWDLAKDKFNLDDYKVVYEGEIDGEGKVPLQVLEELFEIFNLRHPQDFHGHSLSVSDVVELDGVKYYCDSCGWKKLDL